MSSAELRENRTLGRSRFGVYGAPAGRHTAILERYARAREAQADKYFQEIIEIADAATPETVNVARLRVDSRKFTVARLAPKKYGDHISHNVKAQASISNRKSSSPAAA